MVDPHARLAIAFPSRYQGGRPLADRILLIRLGALGDVVRTLPAASALRAAWPDARITWRQRGGNVVIDVPGLNPSKTPCRFAWTFKIVR